MHRERSTHYHLIALRSFVGARENAAASASRCRPGFDERLARACEFALHLHRPDGTIPALSDSDTGDYRELLALAADCSTAATCAGRRPRARGHAAGASARELPGRRLLRPAQRLGRRRDAVRATSAS